MKQLYKPYCVVFVASVTLLSACTSQTHEAKENTTYKEYTKKTESPTKLILTDEYAGLTDEFAALDEIEEYIRNRKVAKIELGESAFLKNSNIIGNKETIQNQIKRLRNCHLVKCVDNAGSVFIESCTSRLGKELIKTIACDNLFKNPNSSKLLLERTKYLLLQMTSKQRLDALTRIMKAKALDRKESEESEETAYRQKVRETAKFLDDVEAARKRR